MLGVEAVAERMGDHVIGHHPTMPGADKLADQEQERSARMEKALAALDLDKNETQVAPPAEDDIGHTGESLPQPPPTI
jgi:hypothetical protein